MKKIYKYPLEFCLGQKQTIDLPEGAKILHADNQHGALCLWALIDPKVTETEVFEIWVHGTGYEIVDDHLSHINTVMCGALVFHIFRAN